MNAASFINTGVDARTLQSMRQDTEHEYNQEELSKALDKTKMVQKEITVKGKHGTYTRKQWVRATDAAKDDSSKATPGVDLGDGSKAAIAKALANGATRDQVMQAAKAAGITWKENDHEGINWMRASMAIQKAGASGKLSTQSSEQTLSGDKKSKATETATKKPTKIATKKTDKPQLNIPNPDAGNPSEFQKSEFFQHLKSQVENYKNGNKIRLVDLVDMAKAIAKVLGGYVDTAISSVDKGSPSSRNYDPDSYKAATQLLPKLARDNGLRCRVVDTTTHSSGYMGARGRRVYASTHPSKDFLVYTTQPNKVPYDDRYSKDKHVVFIEDGKPQHGMIAATSAEYKPNTALIEVDSHGKDAMGGYRLKEVSLNNIKGTYSRKELDNSGKSYYSRLNSQEKQEMRDKAIILPENVDVKAHRIPPVPSPDEPVKVSQFKFKNQSTEDGRTYKDVVSEYAKGIESAYKQAQNAPDKNFFMFSSDVYNLEQSTGLKDIMRTNTDPELEGLYNALKARQKRLEWNLHTRH